MPKQIHLDLSLKSLTLNFGGLTCDDELIRLGHITSQKCSQVAPPSDNQLFFLPSFAEDVYVLATKKSFNPIGHSERYQPFVEFTLKVILRLLSGF